MPVLELTVPVGRPDDVLVRLSGEIDIASLPPIEEAFTAAAVAEVRRMVVDLTGVDFIGVSGINALVRAANGARDGGRDFRVVGASAHLRELCDLLGVAGVLGLAEATCR